MKAQICEPGEIDVLGGEKQQEKQKKKKGENKVEKIIKWPYEKSLICSRLFVPVSLLKSSNRPIFFKCCGVSTDSDKVSPTASWNPGLAPVRYSVGRSQYCR